MSDPSRREAAAALGVAADADAATVRAAFLKRLAADGFVPPEGSVAAAHRLSKMRLPLSAEAQREAARYERADLELFVQQFWRMAPEARARTWENLNLHCTDADVRESLERLKPGLGVPATRHEDWAVDKLATFFREIFLLPPREQAVRRLEWLGERSLSPELAAPAKRFKSADPATAALDPRLIQAALVPEVAALGVPGLDPQAMEKIAAKDRRKAEREAARKDTQPESSEGGGWTFSWHYIWILAIIIRVAVGVGGRGGSSTPTPNYTLPPNYQFPNPSLNPNQKRFNESIRYSPEQVRTFKAYKPGPGKSEPLGYTSWLLAGKPEAVAPVLPGQPVNR